MISRPTNGQCSQFEKGLGIKRGNSWGLWHSFSQVGSFLDYTSSAFETEPSPVSKGPTEGALRRKGHIARRDERQLQTPRLRGGRKMRRLPAPLEKGPSVIGREFGGSAFSSGAKKNWWLPVPSQHSSLFTAWPSPPPNLVPLPLLLATSPHLTFVQTFPCIYVPA